VTASTREPRAPWLGRLAHRLGLFVSVTGALLFLGAGLFALWRLFAVFTSDASGLASLGSASAFPAALLSAASAFGFLAALLFQREELKLQRQELTATREELEGQKRAMQEQAATLSLQRFEGTFFSLVRAWRDCADAVRYKSDGGDPAMRAIAHEIFEARKARRDLPGRVGWNHGRYVALKSSPSAEQYLRSLQVALEFLADYESAVGRAQRIHRDAIASRLSQNEKALVFGAAAADTVLGQLIEQFSLLAGMSDEAPGYDQWRDVFKPEAFLDEGARRRVTHEPTHERGATG
jgi:hypothetical protein